MTLVRNTSQVFNNQHEKSFQGRSVLLPAFSHWWETKVILSIYSLFLVMQNKELRSTFWTQRES